MSCFLRHKTQKARHQHFSNWFRGAGFRCLAFCTWHPPQCLYSRGTPPRGGEGGLHLPCIAHPLSSFRYIILRLNRVGLVCVACVACGTPTAQMNDVFVTRHGARIDKEDSQWLRKAGHSRRDDPHLSADGHQGAQELAVHLAAQQPTFKLQHIVTSPFVRCVETAYPIAEVLDLPLLVEPGICEILTTFPPGFLSAEELRARFPRVDPLYVPIMTAAQLSREHGDGQAARRAGQAAKEVRDRLEGPILFAGHGASCLGLVEAFGGGGYVGYVSLSHFTQSGNGSRWQTVKQGDVGHLSRALARQSLDSAW